MFIQNTFISLWNKCALQFSPQQTLDSTGEWLVPTLTCSLLPIITTESSSSHLKQCWIFYFEDFFFCVPWERFLSSGRKPEQGQISALWNRLNSAVKSECEGRRAALQLGPAARAQQGHRSLPQHSRAQETQCTNAVCRGGKRADPPEGCSWHPGTNWGQLASLSFSLCLLQTDLCRLRPSWGWSCLPSQSWHILQSKNWVWMKAYVQETVYIVVIVFMVIICQLIPVCALGWDRTLEWFHRAKVKGTHFFVQSVFSCTICVNSLIAVCFGLPVCK